MPLAPAAVEVRLEYDSPEGCRVYGESPVVHVVDRDAGLVGVFRDREPEPKAVLSSSELFLSASLVPGLTEDPWVSVPIAEEVPEWLFTQQTALAWFAPGLFRGEIEGALDDLQQLESEGVDSPYEPPEGGPPTVEWVVEAGRVVSGNISGSTFQDDTPLRTVMEAVDTPRNHLAVPSDGVTSVADLPVGPLLASSERWNVACETTTDAESATRACISALRTTVGQYLAETSQDEWLRVPACE